MKWRPVFGTAEEVVRQSGQPANVVFPIKCFEREDGFQSPVPQGWSYSANDWHEKPDAFLLLLQEYCESLERADAAEAWAKEFVASDPVLPRDRPEKPQIVIDKEESVRRAEAEMKILQAIRLEAIQEKDSDSQAVADAKAEARQAYEALSAKEP